MTTEMLAKDVENLHVQQGAAEHGLDSDKMDLYSRQIGAYGMELMGKLVRLRVLVVGLGGVGVETAKNLILAGPQHVALFDPKKTALADLGTNFYLHAQHVRAGLTRAQGCVEQLRTLNPYVQVDVNEAPELTDEFVKSFHVVVFTDTRSRKELEHYNELCRTHQPPIAFIAAETNGACSFAFSDFGPAHLVNDEDGEPTRMNVVEYISENGEVTVASERHMLSDGDYVRFEEVDGMVELNEITEPIEVERIFQQMKDKDGKQREVLIPNRFRLKGIDCSGFGAYTGGGLVSQVKKPKTFNFRSFAESCTNPVMPDQYMGLPHMDMEKLLMKQRGAQLHFARLAIWKFIEQSSNGLPRLHNAEDADACVLLANAILDEHKKIVDSGKDAIVVEELDEEVIRNTALFARTELPGFTAFLGGVLAQEAVKAPGKYTPLSQWLHHDVFELLGEQGPPSDPADPNNPTRYDHQINVFGKAFQEKLFKQKWFLVGAGALGCEYIKGMALIGLGCSPEGMVFCTDMDRIEVSNLSRQFLFRRDHVGQPKSSCAVAAAKVMNPDMHAKTFEVPVGPTTENVFDDAFWENLDGVWNALDNVVARRYTDSKCVLYEKPLLESGTLGTKANSEVILPFQTMTYSDQKEQEEDSIPMCTLRNFPHFIEHCIEWARAQFSDLFEDAPQEVNSFLRDPDAFFAQVEKEGSASAQLETLRSVNEWVDFLGSKPSMETAVRLALEVFQKQFEHRILDLIHHFPKDARKKDKDSGADLGEFWSGHKRFPQAATFDSKDPLHVDFLVNCSNLFAFTFGLSPERDASKLLAIASQIELAPWKPPAAFNIDDMEDEVGNSDDKGDKDEEDDVIVAQLNKKLRSLDASKLGTLQVSDFEKDDDTNFHIDFITACANLRAWNYRIKETTRHKCKMIAGKIIPALATTTAMITGLTELEFYKIVLGLKAEKFANTNVNLAVNSYQSFAPLEPKKAKAEFDVIMCEEIKPIPDGFTVWDKVVVKAGDLTTEQFLEQLAKQHQGVQVQLLFKHGISEELIASGKGKALYNSNKFLSANAKAQNEANLKANLKQLFESTYGALPPSARFILLDGTVVDKDGNSCIIPPIKYFFR